MSPSPAIMDPLQRFCKIGQMPRRESVPYKYSNLMYCFSTVNIFISQRLSWAVKGNHTDHDGGEDSVRTGVSPGNGPLKRCLKQQQRVRKKGQLAVSKNSDVCMTKQRTPRRRGYTPPKFRRRVVSWCIRPFTSLFRALMNESPTYHRPDLS